MTETTPRAATQTAKHAQSSTYVSPTLEVISLDCEISSYAPDDGDVPLF